MAADRIRVFISSEAEALWREREFAGMVCEELGFEPLLFPTQSPSGSRHEYLDQLRQSDVLVLIIGQRMTDPVMEEVEIARHRGIPVLPFFLLLPTADRRGRSISKAADEYKRRHGSVFVKTFESLTQLRGGLRDGLSWILKKRFSSSLVFNHWTPDVYSQATEFLHFAKSRLGMSQATSTLVLGPHRDRRLEEDRFAKGVLRYVGEIASGRLSSTFLHVFNGRATLDALRTDSANYPQALVAGARMQELSKLSQEANARRSGSVRIVATDSEVNASIVGDNSFLMSAFYGARYYAWVDEDAAGANGLWDILDTLGHDGIELDSFRGSVS